MRGLIFFAFCAALALSPLRAADDSIWVEGENPSSTNMKPHPWYAGAVNKSLLSGGDFISNWSDKPGDIEYEVNAPAAGACV